MIPLIISDKFFYRKAEDRVQTAKFAYEKGYYYACSSNLYFALFNFMQSVLGKPPEGKWKHIGIFKSFSQISVEKQLFSTEKLREFGKTYGNLYALRKQADYESNVYDDYTIERLKYFVKITEEVLSHADKS